MIGDLPDRKWCGNRYTVRLRSFCTMRARSLANRSYGAQFAAFERELIFDRPHTGWVHFVGSREIVLGKSPFSEHLSLHPYVLPDNLRIPEGAFVELTVGRLRRERPDV